MMPRGLAGTRMIVLCRDGFGHDIGVPAIQ